MKKIILSIAVLFALNTAVLADSVIATVIHVQPTYEYVTVQVPETRCTVVQVPVYGTVQSRSANGSDVLVGMIAGSLLGKGITGNDDGAVAGAVIGGAITADRGSSTQTVVDYREQRECTEYTVTETHRELSKYLITFRYHDITGEFYTYNNYTVGDRIRVDIGVSVN